MELKKSVYKLYEILKKYKYLFLVLVIGFVLMAIPSAKQNVTQTNESPKPETSLADFENRLSEILSKVDGAGNVMLMLTIAEGEEIKYQSDEKIDEGDTKSNINRETIIITDSERNQNGLIRQVNPVIYQGAVVVCQGADNPVVRLAIVDAVSKLTGLSSNNISVLKMI